MLLLPVSLDFDLDSATSSRALGFLALFYLCYDSVMRWLSDDLFTVLADLFVNLAAGWFGAVLIVPFVPTILRERIAVTLLINLGFGMVSLLIAFRLRRLSKLYL